MPFELNSRLAKGGQDFGKLGICRVLLKNNALFPWLILVPEVDSDLTELHQLEASDFASVCFTIRQMSEFLQVHFEPKKINVASIGNIVSQMHIHVVARTESDPAWPGVVWACDQKQTYTTEEVIAIRSSYEQFTS